MNNQIAAMTLDIHSASKLPLEICCAIATDLVEKGYFRQSERQHNLLWACQATLRDMHNQLSKAKHDIERYGRRIREQREDILDLLAKLDGAIAGQETLQKAFAAAEKCVSCGDVIPEGRQVCPTCENTKGEEK